MLVIVLDATIVNVALPATQDDLGFSAAGLASACSRLPMAVTLAVLRPPPTVAPDVEPQVDRPRPLRRKAGDRNA
jgi:hypothetical protein